LIDPLDVSFDLQGGLDFLMIGLQKRNLLIQLSK